MFTAVAIAQLAQKGLIAFDDLIVKHLPDYPNKEVAQKVTIRSAGIAANFDMFPDTGYTAVILINADPPAIMPVIMKLRELLPAK